MSKVEIVSTYPLKMIQYRNLDYLTDLVSNTNTFDIDENWYEIIIPYQDRDVDIKEIKIDGESLKEILYTGYTTTKKGDIKFIPFLNEDGDFRIWLHGNLGVLLERTMDCIDNGDYGKNLFDYYLLTVERNLLREGHSFSPSVDGYLKLARGPFWWKKHSEKLPYMILDKEIRNKKEILDELQQLDSFKLFEKYTGVHTKSYSNEGYPLIDVEDIEYPYTKELFKQLGYTKILNFCINTLHPNADIYIHRDQGFEDVEAYNKFIKGCQQLYIILDGDPQDNVFKLGCAGRVPTDKPIIVNNSLHAHCVVNYSDKPRTTLLAYGLRN